MLEESAIKHERESFMVVVTIEGERSDVSSGGTYRDDGRFGLALDPQVGIEHTSLNNKGSTADRGPPRPQRDTRGTNQNTNTTKMGRRRISVTSDSSRIVLLGLTFEFSRCVAREMLRLLSSVCNNPRIRNQCNCETKDCLDDVCQHCKQQRNDNHLSYTDRMIQRIQWFHRNHHRYVVMGSWLLLSPSIGWLYNTTNHTGLPKATTAGSNYLSSFVTSIGLLFCLYPELVSVHTKEDKHEIDEYNDHSTENQQPPETLYRSPLRNEREDEFRPRSDSILSQTTEASTPQQSERGMQQKQYLEMLVHNVSHTDLILGLSREERGRREDVAQIHLEPRLSIDSSHTTPPSKHLTKDELIQTDEEKYILCRPRFSAFDMFSCRVKSVLLRTRASNSILSYPRYERSNATSRYTLITPRPGDQFMLPVGFNLEKTNYDGPPDELLVDSQDMPSLRVRGRDISKIDPILLDSPRRIDPSSSGPNQPPSLDKSTVERLRINAVFFPLLSTLVPRWLGQIADKFGGNDAKVKNSNVKKVIVLVSGVGSPRNWTHSASGNSTEMCADLMEMFIHELFPDVTVIK